MKLSVDVSVEFQLLKDEDKDSIASIRSRRHNILNEEDLNNARSNMASDISE